MAFVVSESLFAEWAKACDLPKECRRMIVDLALDDVVMVYYECYGDEEILNLPPPIGAKKVRVGRPRTKWRRFKCWLGLHKWHGNLGITSRASFFCPRCGARKY